MIMQGLKQYVQSHEVPAEYLRHNNNQPDQDRQSCLSQKLLPNSRQPSLISVQVHKKRHGKPCSSQIKSPGKHTYHGTNNYDKLTTVQQHAAIQPDNQHGCQRIPVRITQRGYPNSTRREPFQKARNSNIALSSRQTKKIEGFRVHTRGRT